MKIQPYDEESGWSALNVHYQRLLFNNNSWCCEDMGKYKSNGKKPGMIENS